MLLNYTPPEERAAQVLDIAPHVRIYRHFVRSAEARPAKRKKAKRRVMIFAVSTYSVRPGQQGCTVSVNVIMATTSATAIRKAHQYVRMANPDNYGLRSCCSEVPTEMMAEVLRGRGLL